MINRAILVVFASVWIGAPAAAHACSCVALGAGPPNYSVYDGLFLGKVIFATEVEVQGADGRYRQRVVGFLVERVWKGAKVAIQSVYTGSTVPECGFPFEVGKRYFVSAEQGDQLFSKRPFGKDDRTLFASVCSYTALADDATLAIRALDADPKYEAWSPRWRIAP